MNTIVEHINSAGHIFVEFALPMLIQSSVLIVILLLVDLLLRKKVKAIFRYWIWMLVLLKLVLPTSLSSPLSLGYFFGDKLTYQDLAQTPSALEPAEPAPADISPVIGPLYIQPNAYIPPTKPVISVFEPAMAEPVSPPEVPVTPLSWQGVVFLVWLAVAIAMGLLLLQRAFFVRGLVAQAKKAGCLMNDALAYCCASMGIKSKVGLKISVNATSPSVCGLIRPVILLPRNLPSSLGAGRLRAVLMHELAHIKRGDLWVNLVQTVLQISYFYNPLLWLANCVIRRVREQAVDEAVLVAMGEKARQYPQTLVDVAKLAFKRPALSLRLIGVVESKSALAGRIKHILSRPMPKTAKLGIVGVLAVIIAGAILLPMAAARQRDGWSDRDLLIKFTERERGEPKVVRSAGKATWQKSYDVEFAPWEELLVIAELYQAGKPMRQLGQKVFSGSGDAQTFSVNFVRTYKNDAKTIVGHSGTVELGEEVLEIAEFTVNTQRYFSGEGWGGYHGDGLRRAKARYTKKEYAELKTLFYYHSTDGGGVNEGEANFWIPGHNVTLTGSHHCVVLKMIPLSRLEYLVCEPVGGWQGLDGQAIPVDFTADRAEAIADKYKQMIVDSVEQQWAAEKQAEIETDVQAASLDHFIGKYALARHPDTAAFEITKKGDIFIFSDLGGPKFEMEEAEDGLKFADGGGERFLVRYDASENRYYLDNLGMPGKEREPESIQLIKISAEKPDDIFAATLPNGVTVELVGVCEHPSEGKQWWRPDGQPLGEFPYKVSATYAKSPNKKTLNVIMTISPKGPAYSATKLEFSQGNPRSYWVCLESNGKVVKNWRAGGLSVPPTLEKTDVKVGIAGGPWQKMAKISPQFKEPLAEKTNLGQIQWLKSVNENGSGDLLVYVANNFANKAASHLIAVDNTGKEHFPYSAKGEGNPDVTTYEYRFHLRPNEVRELFFVVRPYQWVSFKNVSLRPGVKTDVQVEGKGPVEPQQLKLNALPEGWKLDYDSGVRGESKTWPSGIADNLVELKAVPTPPNEYDESWKQERLDFEIVSQNGERIGSIIIWGERGLDRITLSPGKYQLLYTRERRDPETSRFTPMNRVEFPVDLSRPGMYQLLFSPKLETPKTTVSGKYPPTTCTGRVADRGGNFLDGADVTAYEMFFDMAGSLDLRLVGKAVTKTDGKFLFEITPSVKKSRSMGGVVVAHKEGFALGWAEWPLYGVQQVTITLGRPTKLTGTVVDENGEGVSDAEIRAVLFKKKTSEKEKTKWLPGIGALPWLAVRTNRHGRFEFSNIPADIRADLVVLAAGFSTIYTHKPENLSAGYDGAEFAAGKTDIKVTMTAEGRIEGKVIDSKSGEGVAGVKLAIVPTFSPFFFERFLCISKEDGTFSIDGLRSGEYLIRGDRKKGFGRVNVTVESGKTVSGAIVERQKTDVQVEGEGAGAVSGESEVAPSEAGPRITFEILVCDLGQVAPRTKHSCEFRFTNTGGALLKITRISSACACATSKLKKKEYKPGESGTLKVTYQSPASTGWVTKHVYVYSNDKVNPKVKLTVKAEIAVKVAHKPERLNILLKGENAGCPAITLTSLDNQPFAITEFKSTGGNSITADFDPSVKETSFVLKPKVDMEKLRKSLRGNIEIGLTHPDCKTLMIIYEALPEFKFDPRVVYVRKAEPRKAVKKKVFVFSNYNEDVEIESSSSKKGTVKVLTQEKVRNGCQLELEITPPAAPETKRRVFTDELTVMLKGGQELKMTCYGIYSKKAAEPSEESIPKTDVQVEVDEIEEKEGLVWGKEVNGLRAAVQFVPEKEAYSYGQIIGLRYHIQNVRGEPVQFISETWRQNDKATVEDEEGNLKPVGYAWYSGWTPVERYYLKPSEKVVLESSAFGLAADNEQAEGLGHPVGCTLVCKPGLYSVSFSVRLPRVRSSSLPPQEEDWEGVLETGKHKLLVTAASRPDQMSAVPVEVKEREVGTVPVIRADDNKATLASGLAVELLGLTEIPIKDNPWWKPNGSVLEQLPFDNVSFDPSRDPNHDQFAYYAVAMKLKGKAPDEIRLIKWNFTDALYAGTTSAYLDDKGVYKQNIRAAVAKFPKDVETTALRLGFASGDWQTLVAGRHYGFYRKGEDSIVVRTPERAGGPFGVRPQEKGLHISVTYNITDRDFRVVAVDKDGKEHFSSRGGSSGTDNLRRTTASFPDLTRDKLQEYRFQVRPHEWVEFEDISLRPGKEAVALTEKRRAAGREELEKWLGQGQTRRIREQILVLRGCRIFQEMEAWASAIRELVSIGKPAVPELLAELRRAQRWPTQSTVAFTLRAIADPRAVPVLIEVLGRVEYRGEYGIHLKDPPLSVFMLENQHRPAPDRSRKQKDPQITIGCPVIEITAALEKITGHTEGHEHYGHKAVAELGSDAPREVVNRRIQEIVREVASRWQKWWDHHKTDVQVEVEQSGRGSKSGGDGIVVVSAGKSTMYRSIPEAVAAAPAGSVIRVGPGAGVYVERPELEVEQRSEASEATSATLTVPEADKTRGGISGVVVSSVTGEPIAGAYVGVGDFGDSSGSNYSRHRSQGFHDKTKTDEQGRFELGGLAFTDDHPYLKYHPLVVTHPDFVRHDEKIELLKDKPIPDVKVSLRPAAKIDVTVVDADGNPLKGHWLIRLEALDGRRFIPPGSDPHLSSFASNIWAHWPDLRAKMGASQGFTFTELDTGQYSIEAIRFHLVDNPTPQNIWQPTITYHGSIPSIEIQAGQAKQVQLPPQDHQTCLTITPPEFPEMLLDKLKRSSRMPLMCLISRSPELLLWDDVKIYHLEDQRLGRIDKKRFFRGFFLQGESLTINNLPPGSYSLFAVAVYGEVAGCLIGARAKLAKGDNVAVEIPWRQPTGPSTVGPNRSFDYPVKLEDRDYSASELCEILTAITQSNPRLIAESSIEDEKLRFGKGEMSIWDVLEKLYLDKGWRVDEGADKTLIIRPGFKTDVQAGTKNPVVGEWEDIGNPVPADFNDTIELTEQITLGSIGRDVEGKTFITFVWEKEEIRNRQYRFVLINKDGAVLEPDGYLILGESERPEEKFTFDETYVPWRLKEFKFQSRPLSLTGTQKISSQLQKDTSGAFEGKTVSVSKLAPPGRYAIELDGVDDYFAVPYSPNLRLEPPFTVEMWIKPKFPEQKLDRVQEWGVIAQGCYIGTGRVKPRGFGIELIRLEKEPAKFHISYCEANDSGLFGKDYGNYRFDDWMHISHVFNGDNYKPGHGHPLVVGKFLIPTAAPFMGQIGEIRIWNTARTSEEIRRYKDVALTGKEPGLAACWTFEQNEGQFAYDISGNNNHARLGSYDGPDDADPKWVDLEAASHQPSRIADVPVEVEGEERDKAQIEGLINQLWDAIESGDVERVKELGPVGFFASDNFNMTKWIAKQAEEKERFKKDKGHDVSKIVSVVIGKDEAIATTGIDGEAMVYFFSKLSDKWALYVMDFRYMTASWGPDKMFENWPRTELYNEAWTEYLKVGKLLYEGADRAEVAKRFSSIGRRYSVTRRGKICSGLGGLLAEMAAEDRGFIEPENLQSLPTDKKINYYIFKLRDVAEQEMFIPGKCRVLSYPATPNSPAVALKEMGKAVVPDMIALLEDRRPTRSVGQPLNGGVVLRYCDVALEIIEAIAQQKFDRRTHRGAFLSTADNETREQVISYVKAWLEQDKQKTAVQVDVEGAGKSTNMETQTLSFGPVVNCVVYAIDTEKDSFIDFDTGKYFNTPKKRWLLFDFDVRNLHHRVQWAKKTGADAAVRYSSGGRLLVMLWSYGIAAKKVEPDNWQDLRAEQAVQYLSKAIHFVEDDLGHGDIRQEPPDTTHIFKTREGGVGIIQIVGFTNNPMGVKIRYKMVQKESARKTDLQVGGLKGTS